MNQKQTDARRMLKRGASIKEIQTYLNRMYGSGLHTCDLAKLRRGETPTTQSRGRAAVKPPAPKPKPTPPPKPESEQLPLAVDVAPSNSRVILLHPDGTWTYGN